MRLLHAALAATLVPATAAADAPQVAADVAPIHALVARVMQGVGEPSLVIRPGASPHSYAMRPSEAAALQSADLVVWTGEALTPWLEGPLQSLARGEALELMSVEGTVLLPYRGHDEPAGGVDFGDGAHHDHGGGHDDIDPHAWLDPENGKLWLAAIAGALARVDPQNAAAYRENAAAGQAEIDRAAEDATRILAPHREAPFVAYHDAYAYFAARFGLRAVTALSLGDAAPPGPARVKEVAAEVAASGAHCVFAEPQFAPGIVEAVADGAGARVETLDPLGGSLASGPAMYPGLIRSLADTIAQCGEAG